MADRKWRMATDRYCPLKAGSIDATDAVPHDRGIVRALGASHRPPLHLKSRPHCSVFVGRLPLEMSEATLRGLFAKEGDVVSLRLVRDYVSGTLLALVFYTFINYTF